MGPLGPGLSSVASAGTVRQLPPWVQISGAETNVPTISLLPSCSPIRHTLLVSTLHRGLTISPRFLNSVKSLSVDL